MKHFVFTLLLFCTFLSLKSATWSLPVACSDRQSTDCIRLTEIGTFGLRRKERPGVPSHLHTGIDIKRPNKNYSDEPVFPAAPGVIISVRNDGPYAQIIIEHREQNTKTWTVYEHISGIRVNAGDEVRPDRPIARFMNTDELNKYGWKFDHLHFEVMKMPPVKLKPLAANPQRFFNSYGLVCYSEKDLEEHYYDPLRFLSEHFK